MIQKQIEKISGPRQAWKIRYNLHEVIMMTICAVVAECEAWYQIEHYCKSKKEWFQEKLKLKLHNGVPSHDTFERLFAMIEPREPEASFGQWIGETVKVMKGETISIDGKTICGSADDESRAIHMVSAWANKQRLVLGQIKTDDKSNEIKAVPQLLDMLDVAFNEDRCRMRRDNSGENFAVIRHIALNLLKKDDSKMSLKAKRHRCAYDDDFLAHVLFDSI